jgi:hypothetical protein
MASTPVTYRGPKIGTISNLDMAWIGSTYAITHKNE